jgi:predicted DNA-binding transcriptional regulator AlpA
VPSKLLTPTETAARTGLAVATLATRRSRGGDAPPFVYVGARVRYPEAGVERWIRARQKHRTARPGSVRAPRMPRPAPPNTAPPGAPPGCASSDTCASVQGRT